VTAVEQPVGLQLDLSKGLVLGPELVAPIDFNVGWTFSGSLVVFNSATSFTSASTANVFKDYFTVGVWYKMTFRATFTGSINLYNSNTAINGIGPAAVVSGTEYTFYFLAAATQLNIRTFGATIVNVDSVSVKSLAGNHRFQTTSANRPVVSARVNLLTNTETLSGAIWSSFVSGSAVTNTAGTLNFPNSISGSTYALWRAQTSAAAGAYTSQVEIKAGTTNKVNLILSDGTGATIATTVCNLTADYQTFTVSGTCAANARLEIGANGFTGSTMSAGTVLVRNADLRPTNQGVGLPAYQRVNTSTDYDSTGFPTYIKPNGSNQFMVTNSINFSATDKMTVWQGVRKLSDAASFPVIVETSIRSTSQPGSFVIHAPFLSGTSSYYFNVEGTLSAAYIATTFASPVTNVLSCGMDIAGAGIANELFPRVNAAVPTLTINGSSAGTGNFGNYPAYFYMRGGTSLPFGGHDYGSIARGAASTAAQITNGETYINSKTKAY
jgi:hypothetical protein